MKNARPQLSIRVANKNFQDIEPFKIHHGGNIYYDRSGKGCYVWSIQSREDILNFLEYFENHIFRSNKSKRFFLIKEYFKLRGLKAYQEENLNNKAWVNFLNKWHGIHLTIF